MTCRDAGRLTRFLVSRVAERITASRGTNVEHPSAASAEARESPNDSQAHSLLGVALAYQGRVAEARQEGERGIALLPLARDRDVGAYAQLQLVRRHLLAGEKERALDLLEPLLGVPWALTPAWLRIDPTFAPLRGNGRFERLAAAGR